MKRAYLVYDIKAKGKGRPRFTSRGKYVRTYTPKETIDYCNMIRDTFIKEIGLEFKDYEGAVRSTLHLFFAPAKSVSEKKKKELIGKPFLKKPDNDNSEKSIWDALNGVAYVDDCQIYHNTTIKRYNEKDFIVLEFVYEDI
jgi:Holliday junction resolvase RusA-like endonuclease